MKKRQTLVALLSLLLVLVLLTGCSPGAAEKEEEITYSTVTSKNGHMTFTIPSTWNEVPGELNSDGDLELANPESGHFILGMMQEGSAFDGSLEEYREAAAESIGKAYGLTLSDPQATVLAGYPAYRYQFETVENATPVTFRVYVLRTERHLVDLYVWSSTEQKDEEREAILGILNSLQEKDLPEKRTVANADESVGFTAVPKGWYQTVHAEDGADEVYVTSLDQKTMAYATTLKKGSLAFSYFDEVMRGSMESTYNVDLSTAKQEKQLEHGTASVYEFESNGFHFWLYNVETETRYSTLLSTVSINDLEKKRAEVEALLESFAEL